MRSMYLHTNFPARSRAACLVCLPQFKVQDSGEENRFRCALEWTSDRRKVKVVLQGVFVRDRRGFETPDNGRSRHLLACPQAALLLRPRPNKMAVA
jgi:hypothetical protein